MSQPRAWSKRLVAAALALGASAAVVILLEAALRRAGWRARTADFTLPGNHAAAFDTSGKFRRHSERYFSLGGDYRLAPDHAGRFATGAWPFRGRPPEPAPASIARVGVFGDSCVYGESVSTSASLPELLQRELAARGHPADRVQVLNFGVPGYSTVQIRLCLEEALARVPLDAAVFYPAAWNDQAPSLGAGDLEVLGQQREAWLARALPATRNALAHLVEGPPPPSFEEQKEAIKQRMLENRPRVAADEVERQMAGILARCRAAGVRALVVLPAHRPGTAATFPRTEQDRESVRRAALAAGVSVVDGEAALAASGADGDELFLDSVHPSPAGYALLARAAAEHLAPLVPERGTPSAPWRVASVAPARLSALGDRRVTVTLAGARVSAGTVVTVGGAPLLDLRVEGDDRLSGLVMANGPGALEVVVQAAEGCALAPAPLELVGPQLSPAPGGELVLRSRPGDALRVMWSPQKRAAPRWRPEGEQWIEDEFRALFRERVLCGPDGEAVLDLGASLLEGEQAWLQPVVEVLSPEGWVLASYVGEPCRWSAGGD